MDFDDNNLNEEQNKENGDRNVYDPYSPYAQMRPPAEPNQSLVNAAMILGILAIVTTFIMTVYLPFVLGGIAIMLAILSRRKDGKLHKQAKLGIGLAIIGMVLNTILVSTSLYTVFTNPKAKEEFNTVCEQMYGMSFDEMMEAIENGEQIDIDYSNIFNH